MGEVSACAARSRLPISRGSPQLTRQLLYLTQYAYLLELKYPQYLDLRALVRAILQTSAARLLRHRYRVPAARPLNGRGITRMSNVIVGLPDPPVLISDVNPAVMLAFFGATAIAALGLACYWAFTRRDVLPIVTCISAVICSLNEPIFDILGKITYAENNPIAFTAFGRSIPWFLVIGYIAWVGLFPYVIAGWMAAGWSNRRLYVVSVLGTLSVVGTEVVNRFLHGWKYYGEPPLQFFGGVAAMASVPLVAGFLLYALAFPATGFRRVIAGLFIPLLSLPMMFASTGLPLYLALYSNLPPVFNYIAVVALLVLIAAAVVGTVHLGRTMAQRWSPRFSARQEWSIS